MTRTTVGKVTEAPPATLRRVALHASGMARRASFGRGRAGAARTLDHLGHVQLDTISVIARAHDHIFASRVPGYRNAHLQQLVAEREAFEYWAHAAAVLPMDDFRHALPRMARMAARHRQLNASERGEMKRVLARVRSEGPLRARDFSTPPGHRGGWWAWKPAKLALERLFHEGALMVAGREGFEKRFDLTERVLPSRVDTRPPDLAEHATWLVARARRHLGVFTARHAYYQRRERGLGKAVAVALQEACERGELAPLSNATLNDGRRWLVDTTALETFGQPISRRLRALSPFDPLVIHRDRLSALFGFDYQLECYLPEAKRRFGYFSLPLVTGTRLIGRADCKAERSARLLTCRHLALEPGAENLDPTLLRAGLCDLAHMNDCSSLRVERVSGIPDRRARQLARALSASVSGP